MKPRPPLDTTETRAEVARRRLEQLVASFDDAQGERRPPVRTEPAAEPVRAAGHRREDARPAARLRLDGVHARLLATLGVAAGVLLTWWLLAERPRTAEVGEPVTLSARTAQEPAAPGAAPSAAPTPADQEVVVDVVGKVREPGIITLPPGSRVHEAIEAAGGLKGKVDTSALNLARVLADGEQVLVGVEPVAVPAPAAGAAPGTAGAPAGAAVNLNSATPEQLETLPGVGPVTAGAIVAWRTENGTFGSVDDLLEVTGIGEKTLATLRDLVTV